LYEDRTRKYDPIANEKHPIHGTPYLTKDKSPVSEEEHRVNNEDEIDESHKSQLKFYYPRESFREGLCNHRRWFVCLSVCLLPR